MALTFFLSHRGEKRTWHVGERVPFFPLPNLEGIVVDGRELEYLRRSPTPFSLWRDRAFLTTAVARSENRDAALVIYGMLLAQTAP